MSDQARLAARPANHPVWHRLQHYRVGPADALLGFSERLARENEWSLGKAERALEEYRRFAFLAVTTGQEVTPSDAVDQVWHLHLTYTQDYWQRFCPEILGCDLQHGPTAGGMAERDRFFEQYAQTLKAYEATFGPPPADLWPSAAQRFLVDPRARRVHPREGLIVQRGKFFILLLMALMVGVAAGWMLFGRT